MDLQSVTSIQFSVGKIDAGMAILLSPDHHLVEFPSAVLPEGLVAGSIVNMTIERNMDLERQQKEEFMALQEELFSTYNKLPKIPVISVKSVTQTSAIITWEPVELYNSDFISIDLYKNGQKLGNTPTLTSTSTKITGLDVAHEYTIWMNLRTSAGVFKSNTFQVKTQSLENLSGIFPSFGSFTNPDEIEALIRILEKIGARYSDEFTQDNTHLICTVARGPKYEKALEWNIPVVTPEWLKACDANGKMMPSNTFYVAR